VQASQDESKAVALVDVVLQVAEGERRDGRVVAGQGLELLSELVVVEPELCVDVKNQRMEPILRLFNLQLQLRFSK
jgi:hypothetical protein